jgi:hypothetical protein
MSFAFAWPSTGRHHNRASQLLLGAHAAYHTPHTALRPRPFLAFSFALEVRIGASSMHRWAVRDLRRRAYSPFRLRATRQTPRAGTPALEIAWLQAIEGRNGDGEDRWEAGTCGEGILG